MKIIIDASYASHSQQSCQKNGQYHKHSLNDKLQEAKNTQIHKPLSILRNDPKRNNTSIFKKEVRSVANTATSRNKIAGINTAIRKSMDLKLRCSNGVKSARLLETSGILPRLEVQHFDGVVGKVQALSMLKRMLI